MLREIKRGAEAVLSIGDYQEGLALFKDRVSKRYRIPELDIAIRRQRTRKEAKLLDMSRRSGILTPSILKLGEFTIVMEYLGKDRVKDVLNGLPEARRKEVYALIGGSVARMHAAGIIHGDLTTSNMMLKENETKLYLIDFGLGRFSAKTEDQAVDLFLLYEALKSTHFRILDEAWGNVLNTYSQNYTKAGEVLNRLEKIKKRRRYLGG